MTFPAADTLITYPEGDVSSSGTVVHVEPLGDGRSAIILDRTAAHPVDTAWPDQPADRGTLTVGDVTHPFVDVVTGGIADGRLYLGADLPVRGGTEGWTFVVAHIIDGDRVTGGDRATEGDTAQVEVDAAYRAALSAGHTACHLASLALDAALADAWTKPVSTDALGNPAFDALAIQSSRIHENGSVDVYRIGKSLRKKGFTVSALNEADALANRVNEHLARWIAPGGAVHIERADAALSARRTWVCELAEGRTNIPCGGTHVSDLAAFASITVSLVGAEVDGGRQLTMTTTALIRD